MATLNDITAYGQTIADQSASVLKGAQIGDVGGKLEDMVSSAFSDTTTSLKNMATPITDFLGFDWGSGSGSDLFSSVPLSDVEGEAINYKVRLVSVLGLLTAFQPGDIGSVIFDSTPTFNESGGVNYTPVQPVHLPGSIQTYKSTDARTFNIVATIISRNTADVAKNMMYLQTLRSWRYPFFGQSTTSPTSQSNAVDRIKNSTTTGTTGDGSNVNLLGAPPELLYLYAYSTSGNDKRQFKDSINRVNINRVPVLLTSLSIEYPQDVDYIPSSSLPDKNTEPFPVKMSVSLSLIEAHSPVEYEKFNLTSYKNGTLANF